MSVQTMPPPGELFTTKALVARHPNLLTKSRLEWCLRNRETNGLASVVFDTKCKVLLIHEPTFLQWFLGLSCREKPRRARTVRAEAVAP